jgi:hypothetical protein
VVMMLINKIWMISMIKKVDDDILYIRITIKYVHLCMNVYLRINLI